MSVREQPDVDLRKRWRCDPRLLLLLSSGFALSSALFSAVELGVFDRLADGPRSLDELAAELGTPAAALERLVVLLCALGLLERTDDGRLVNAELASAALTSGSAHSLRPFLLHQQRHMVPLFAHLSDALRSGETQQQHLPLPPVGVDDRGAYPTLAASRDDHRLFLAAMNAVAVDVGRVIAEHIDVAAIHRLLDFGGGGGQVAIELVEAVPHLHVTIVDVPEACAFAEEIVAARGLADRIDTCAGDFLGELPPSLAGADAVLLGGVLADWDDTQRRVLLANAHRCLRSGGVLLASETLLDDDGDGPVLPALLSLSMLVAARGKNFTARELVEMLHTAGFVDAKVVSNRARGVRDLVIATRV